MKCIFLITLFFTQFSIAQTKGDTQVWIKSTVENFADRNQYNNLNVYFDNNKIWFVEREDGGTFHKELDLKYITQIIIKENNSGYTLILGCSYDKLCCEMKHYKITNEGTARLSEVEPDNKGGVNILLVRGLREDNMVQRLKKAISHLISLNGGKVISDTF